jgi:hypothetical protein
MGDIFFMQVQQPRGSDTSNNKLQQHKNRARDILIPPLHKQTIINIVNSKKLEHNTLISIIPIA